MLTLAAAWRALSAPAAYLAVCAGILAVNRSAARPVSRGLLLACLAIPLLIFSPTFLFQKTVIPTDHIVSPWASATSHREPFFNPNLDDIITQLAPWQRAVSRAWRSVTVPWRFPWSGCGTALASNSQSAPFSPLTILAAFVPVSAAFSLEAALKLLAVLLGTFLFLRQLDISTEAAVFGSVSFGLGMVTTVWIFYPAGSVACAMPLGLYFIERTLSNGATRKVLFILALTCFVGALNGHPETLAVTLVLLLAWTALSPARPASSGSRRVKLQIAWAILAGVGLAAFLLKPEYDSVSASSRRASIVDSSPVGDRPWLPHAPRVPFVFASMLMPTALGDEISSPPVTDKLAFFDGALGYAGILALGCAAAGSAVFLVASLFRRKLAILPFFAGVDKVGWLEIATGMLASLFFLVAGRRRWPPRAVAAALIVLAGGELLAQAARLYRFHDPSNLFPPTALTRFLKERSDRWRVIGLGPVLFPNSGAFAEVRDVRTHDPMEREDYSQLLCAATGADPRSYYNMVRRVDSRYLDFLSVRYAVTRPGNGDLGGGWGRIYSGPDGAVFENPFADPVVMSPTLVREIPPAAAGVNALVRFGISATEIVDAVARGETLVLASPEWQSVSSGNFARVAITEIREKDNEVVFSAANSSPSRPGLAVASLVQDGGWRARDDRGRPLPTTLANGPFLAVAIPPGAARIQLRYRPPGLAAGLGMSLAALASLVVLLAAGRRGRTP